MRQPHSASAPDPAVDLVFSLRPDRAGPGRVKNESGTHFFAKVRKWPKKHGKNDNVFHCFSTWAKKEQLFALFRKSAKSAKMTSKIIDFL